MTFCPACDTMGEVWDPEQGEMVLCEKCGGIGVIKKKRLFERKDFPDERIDEDTE